MLCRTTPEEVGWGDLSFLRCAVVESTVSCFLDENHNLCSQTEVWLVTKGVVCFAAQSIGVGETIIDYIDITSESSQTTPQEALLRSAKLGKKGLFVAVCVCVCECFCACLWV